MKRINGIIAASIFVFLIPFAIASGQEKKTEQRIKIVVDDGNGSDVILDTLISGKPSSDTLVLKNGKTIYLAHEGTELTEGNKEVKKYIVTSDSPDGDPAHKKVSKQITIISSDDSDGGKEMENCNHQAGSSECNKKVIAYTIDSGNMDSDSEKTKYVIARDGIRITVEGSDYDKVKDVIKDIEKTLDSRIEAK